MDDDEGRLCLDYRVHDEGWLAPLRPTGMGAGLWAVTKRVILGVAVQFRTNPGELLRYSRRNSQLKKKNMRILEFCFD